MGDLAARAYRAYEPATTAALAFIPTDDKRGF
jgi:hypothetical protein